MNKLNILKISAVMLMALIAAVSCDEQYDYYKVGKNNPTVRTLDVSEEQVGETWVTLIGSVKWEQSTSDHSFDCRFAISESPDFPAGETDTLYSSWNRINQEDTTTHYYEVSTDVDVKPGTTYYYAFSITDDIVEVSGETKSFTTLGEASDDPDNPTDEPRLVIPESEYVADAVGGDPSIGVVIENYDGGYKYKMTVGYGDGGEDWISDFWYMEDDRGETEIEGRVGFIVEPNETGNDRSCSIFVRLNMGVVEQTEYIFVYQPSMSVEEQILIMPEGIEFFVEAEGGDYDAFIPFTIENYSYEYFENHGEPELWIANSTDWLTNVEYAYLEYESGGNCTGYINLTADANTSGSDRTGSFEFGLEGSQSYGIYISQPAGEAGEVAGEINGHEWVDLGLSVRWATCNIGASSPSEYGDYYSWGETETKTEYFSENSITWEQDISDISGDPRYDAATANWGEGWRLPSSDELKELVDECTWVWMTEDGHGGFKVTGPNGVSIFLPTNGYKLFDFETSSVGEVGHYWSSSPKTENYEDGEGADMLYFNNESDKGSVFGSARWHGLGIRPVADK